MLNFTPCSEFSETIILDRQISDAAGTSWVRVSLSERGRKSREASGQTDTPGEKPLSSGAFPDCEGDGNH